MSARLSISTVTAFELGLPPRLLALMLATLLVACTALFVAALPAWLTLLLLLLTLCASLPHWQRWQRLRGVQLRCERGAWELDYGEGRRRRLLLCPQYVGGDSLMLLRFRDLNGRALCLLLCADRYPAESWRLLRRQLFSSLSGESSVAAG